MIVLPQKHINHVRKVFTTKLDLDLDLGMSLIIAFLRHYKRYFKAIFLFKAIGLDQLPVKFGILLSRFSEKLSLSGVFNWLLRYAGIKSMDVQEDSEKEVLKLSYIKRSTRSTFSVEKSNQNILQCKYDEILIPDFDWNDINYFQYELIMTIFL